MTTPILDRDAAPAFREESEAALLTETDARFAPRPKLTMLHVDKIEPSQLNPRKSFDPAKLEELAASIRAHGVQQPIVVRQTVRDGDPATERAGGIVTYSIVMGERRWRAARIAGMSNVPCLVRTDLDDKTHALLAMEENEKRSDLNAIERARGYRQCMDLGVTQSQLGEKAGVGHTRISNLIRLLDLPDSVLAMIEDGRLTAAHGIALLSKKFAGHGPLIAAAAGWAVETKAAVAELEKGVPHSAAVSVNEAGKARALDYRARFDTTICKKCPFGAHIRDTWGQEFCGKPSHWNELQHLAAAELEAKAVEAARETATAKGVTLAPGEKPAPLPKVRDLGQYMVARSADTGGACTGDCPCRVKAVNASGQIEECCTDPARYTRFCTEAREAIQDKRQQAQGPRAEAAAQSFGRYFEDEGDSAWSRALAWDALMSLDGNRKEVIQSVLDRLFLTLDVSLLKDAKWDAVRRRPALAALEVLRPTTLIRLVALVRAEDEIRRTVLHETPTEFLDYFLAGQATPIPQFPVVEAKAEVEPVADAAPAQEADEPISDEPTRDVPLCASCGISEANVNGKFCDWCDGYVPPDIPETDCPLDTEPAPSEPDPSEPDPDSYPDPETYVVKIGDVLDFVDPSDPAEAVRGRIVRRGDVTNITPAGKLWLRIEGTGRRVLISGDDIRAVITANGKALKPVAGSGEVVTTDKGAMDPEVAIANL